MKSFRKIHFDFWAGLGIFLLAFTLRLAYLFFLKENYFFYDNPGSDVLYYREWAHRIAAGKGGAGVFFGYPLFPYFLALLERVSFGSLTAIRILHLLLGSFNCVLVFEIGRRIFSPKVGCLAGILAAINFMLIYYDWLLMPVTLIIFLSLVFVLFFLEQRERFSARGWGLLGLLAGVAALGDGKFLILGVLLIVYQGISCRRQTGPFLKKMLVPFITGLLIVLALVAARNKAVGGSWTLISAHSGINFYIGNNSEATGVFENPDLIRPTHEGHDIDQQLLLAAQEPAGTAAGDVTGFWYNKAFDFITSNPADYVVLLAQKFRLFFTQHEATHDVDLLLQRKWRRTLDLNPYILICPFALLGAALSLRDRRARILMLFIGSQLIFTLIFFLINRHRVSVLPFFILFESYSLFWILDKIRGHDWKKLTAALTWLILFIVLMRPVEMNAEELEFLAAVRAGPIFEQRGDYEQARAYYQHALRLRPDDVHALFNLGNTYLQTGFPKQAITYYRQALEYFPHHVDALYNLAYAYEQSGSPEQALVHYRKVVKLTPESPDAHFRMAEIYRREGRCVQAEDHYRKVISLRPELSPSVSSLLSSCPSR